MPAGTRALFEPKRYRPTRAPNVLAKILAQRGVDWASFRGFDKKIAIIRDPRDQLVSFVLYAIYNHSRPLTSTEADHLLRLLSQKESDNRSVPLWCISEAIEGITGIDHRALLRERHALCCRALADDPQFFRVWYKDFVAGETEALAAYLGFAMPSRVDVPTSLRRVERTRGAGDWRNWFTPEDVAYFRPDLDGVMRTLGIPDDWSLSDTAVVAPEHGSQYVGRLIDAQRQRTRWRSRWRRGVRKAVDWARDRFS